MTELIDIYDLDEKPLGTQERAKFYSEIKVEFAETGKISRRVKRSVVLLMNSKGRIYLQKRSKLKKENSGMYDKTIGGHVAAGDSFDLTCVRECAEELGFPASILAPDEFEKAVKNTNLRIVAIFRAIDCISNSMSTRISSDGSKFLQPYISTMYIGYYDGPIRFVDGESSGVEVFSLDELEQDIKDNPGKFTEDLKFMIGHYKEFLLPIDKN